MLAHIWHWIITSRYTRALEDEVMRLRAENRALMNSILGVAGVPPLKLDVGPSACTNGAALRNGWPSAAAESQSDAGSSQTPNSSARIGSPLAPIRRRSWQQIGRLLEHQAKNSG
jgi:hypothetical protein